MTLLKLAARVEALAGPCRETDAMIVVAVSGDAGAWVVTSRPDSVFTHVPGWFRTSDNRSHLSPAYTASLDAAMMLVPDGMVWNAGNDTRPWAHVWRDKKLYDGVPNLGHAATLALALTAAALRARAAMENAA